MTWNRITGLGTAVTTVLFVTVWRRHDRRKTFLYWFFLFFHHGRFSLWTTYQCIEQCCDLCFNIRRWLFSFIILSKLIIFFVTVPPVSHAPLLLVHGCLFFCRLALNANTCLTFAGHRGFCVSVFFLHLYVTPIFRLRRRRHSSVCAFISSLVSPKFHLGTASLKRKFSLWSSSQRLILCHSWWRAPFRFLFWKSWMEVVVVAGRVRKGEGGGWASVANNFLLTVASIFPVVSGLFIAEHLRI